MKFCIFAMTGENFTGYYNFMKGFYGLAVILTILQDKIDQSLENQYLAWLDDIIVVTRRNSQKHELIEV